MILIFCCTTLLNFNFYLMLSEKNALKQNTLHSSTAYYVHLLRFAAFVIKQWSVMILIVICYFITLFNKNVFLVRFYSHAWRAIFYLIHKIQTTVCISTKRCFAGTEYVTFTSVVSWIYEQPTVCNILDHKCLRWITLGIILITRLPANGNHWWFLNICSFYDSERIFGIFICFNTRSISNKVCFWSSIYLSPDNKL
jgi:hypothetical protein